MIFPDFDKIQANAKRRGDESRMMAEEGVMPEVGEVYTVSPDFKCGDRSWTDCFWRVLSFSGPNVLVEIIGRHEQLTRLFRTDERSWYPADDAFATFQAARENNDD